MAIDISDDNEVSGGSEGRDDFADIVHPQMLVSIFFTPTNVICSCSYSSNENLSIDITEVAWEVIWQST